MSKRVLFDTNVIIDVLTNRESFVAASNCEVNQAILKHAAMLDGKDFEDNVQIASTYAYQLDFIVTRDKKGFVRSSVPALTPQELITQIKVEKDG